MKKYILLLTYFFSISGVYADIQYEKDPYKITINDVVSWYHADLGIESEPAGVDKYLLSEGNGKVYLYDGEPRGWAQVYFPNGRLKRKLYFNPDFSSDNNGRVKHKSFDYFYYQGDIYASFGNGTTYPMFWLKNGKPYNGMLTLGHPSKSARALKGDLDSPSGDKGAWFRLYVKNGLANGVAKLPGTLTTDSGKFKNGFKNGYWDKKSEIDFDEDGIDDHYVTKYELGKEIETINKIQQLRDNL